MFLPKFQASLALYFFMTLYVIDKEGWVDVHESEDSIEQSLEVLDINSNEYEIINNLSYVYGWQPSSITYCGFKLVKTHKRNSVLLAKVSNQNAQQFKI